MSREKSDRRILATQLSELIHILGLKKKEFAAELGISPTHVTDLTKAQADPSPALIKAICFRFKVNEIWLTAGEGATFETEEMGQTLDANPNYFPDMISFAVPPDLDPKVEIMVTQLIDIMLSSDSAVKSALESSLIGFHKAVRKDGQIDDLQKDAQKKDQQIREMRRDIEALKKVLHPHVPDGSEVKER
jgi:transcriptional regulator with XRE-family HTH domain